MQVFTKPLGFVLLCWNLVLGVQSSHAGEYMVGAGIYDITGAAAESNLFGYANSKDTDGLQQRIFSRAFIIASQSNSNNRVVFISADLGAIFQSVKLEVVKKLKQKYGSLYTNDNVMLTATHTHVGSGGLSHYTLYQIASADTSLAGYSSQNFKAVVDGIVSSIERAHGNLTVGSVDLVQGELLGASVNRSLDGYNQNLDKNQYSNDTNKAMTLLRLTADNGEELGMINWFAVHNTSLSNNYTKLSGDNKGYAQYRFEKDKNSDHRQAKTFVAAFANSDEGDVVPSDGNANSVPGFQGSSNELSNAVNAGQRQYDKAKTLFAETGSRMNGSLVAKHVWANMENFWVRPEFSGNGWQKLCSAARGFSFAAGGENGPSNIDGITEGMTIHNTGETAWDRFISGSPIIGALQFIAGLTGLSQDDSCQHDKPILLSTGNLNWVPEILPFQIFVVGELAIIAAPSEVTTMAGRRIRAEVLSSLAGYGVNQAVIAGLANTYSGYLSTPEEFQSQQYEGASTAFGKHTLAAYMQTYSELSDAILDGSTMSSATPIDKINQNRLERTGVVADGKYWYESWGKVLQDANSSYSRGSQVKVTFRGGHPKNNLRTQNSYLIVQRKVGSNWQDYAYDWDWNTEYRWKRKGVDRSDIDIIWRIPADTPSGDYRIRHFGNWKNFWDGKVRSYNGTSRKFTVS